MQMAVDARDHLAQLAAEQATERQRMVDQQRNQRSPARMCWYLTCPLAGQSDRRAMEWLRRSGFQTYYPMVRERRLLPKREQSLNQRRAGIEIISDSLKAFLPRYVFVRMDMTAGDWRIVTEVGGVAGVVCKQGSPVLIRDELVNRLRARESEGNGAIPGAMPALTVFGIGETVRIADGPFVGFSGIVEKLRTRVIADVDVIERLTVTVDIFGRTTPVEFEIDQVQKL